MPGMRQCQQFFATAAQPGGAFLPDQVMKYFSRVTAFLDQKAIIEGYSRHIRADNGPGFTGKRFQQWAEQRGIHIEYIEPGKPTDNAFIESFHGKFRDECLNEYW